MKHHKFIIVLLLTFGVASATQLPNQIFEAFKKNKIADAKKLVMTETLYRKMVAPENEDLSDENVKSASKRSKESLTSSFSMIQRTLVQSGFNWGEAELVSVQTIVKVGLETKRVKYDENNKTKRLDLLLTIKSENKKILIKIDDCFLVDDKRYIGNGFKLMSWAGFKINPAEPQVDGDCRD